MKNSLKKEGEFFKTLKKGFKLEFLHQLINKRPGQEYLHRIKFICITTELFGRCVVKHNANRLNSELCPARYHPDSSVVE